MNVCSIVIKTLCVQLLLYYVTCYRAEYKRLLARDLIAKHAEKFGNGENWRAHLRPLKGTNLKVSELCLGTMNFGDQVTTESAIEILNTAVDQYGINFIDTAESFPIPYSPQTSGRSEKIIGKWMQGRVRNDIILSTKICAYSKSFEWLRASNTPPSLDQMEEAVNAQLTRLKTDYIDVLSVQWPQRYVPMAGEEKYDYGSENDSPESEGFVSLLEAMQGLVRSGKIRHFGVCNETPYGLTKLCTLAQANALPKPCMLMNPYNLLERSDFEMQMQEVCSYEGVPFIPHSLLAGGALTGKYIDAGTSLTHSCRLHKYPGFTSRYLSDASVAATKLYSKILDDVPLEKLAIAFVCSRPFVTSSVLGVSSIDQLHSNIHAVDFNSINDEIEADIDKVYKKFASPTRGECYVADPSFEEDQYDAPYYGMTR